jgi:hypothetical protein
MAAEQRELKFIEGGAGLLPRAIRLEQKKN